MKPSETIREIWQEVKELQRLRKDGCGNNITTERKLFLLEDKYENIEILFGHENTLLKALIYYLDNRNN